MSASNFRIKRICKHCNKEFEAQKFSTQYCSDNCSKRAYKIRVRTQKVETLNKEIEILKAKPIEELKAKDFLSIEETCQLLGVSRWTIWRAINASKISSAKIGKRIIIKRSDLDKLLSAPEPVKIKPEKKTVPIKFDEKDCYNLIEVQMKYGISEAALYQVIKRKNIPKIRSGAYALVPKTEIDKLFT